MNAGRGYRVSYVSVGRRTHGTRREAEKESQGQVLGRFRRILDLYRRPDGREWGGQHLENATDGAVTRSYVANLKKGRIGSPGLDKLETIAKAMGFPPELWFGPTGDGERVPDEALMAASRFVRHHEIADGRYPAEMEGGMLVFEVGPAEG